MLDDGADLTELVHEEYLDFVEGMKGVSEETATGVRGLGQRERAGTLRVPVIGAILVV